MLGVVAALAGVALALSFGSGAAAQPAPDLVERQATVVRDQFMRAVRDCGVTPTYDPGIVVRTHPGVVAYFYEDRSAHLSRWSEMPPPVAGMVTAWAANGTLGLTPEEQFGEIFNSLLLPHELGHYLQHMSGRFRTLDKWEAEVEANRIAIAFWSLDPASAERLPARIENFTRFLGQLRNPVPAGVEPRDHFNANYEQLGSDAEAYGWYQGAFMRTAWAERGQTDFCRLVRLNTPQSAPSS